MLKENGMDAKTDVEMIQVAIGTEPGPFAAKQADIAVMYEPGLDQAVAKGMKVVFGFPKSYGAYAFSAVTARNDIDPDIAQRVVNGMEMAMRFMAKDEAKTVENRQEGISDARPRRGRSRGQADARRRRLSAERGRHAGGAEGLDGHADRARQSAKPAGLQVVRGAEIHRVRARNEVSSHKEAPFLRQGALRSLPHHLWDGLHA
jgi:ABC-type nitrate/sulfonate/bicarbonate transport system substrate-binding protein